MMKIIRIQFLRHIKTLFSDNTSIKGRITMSLTLYFNDSFSCGVVEYHDELNPWIVKGYIFGSKPKVEDIVNFIHTI